MGKQYHRTAIQTSSLLTVPLLSWGIYFPFALLTSVSNEETAIHPSEQWQSPRE